MERWPSG